MYLTLLIKLVLTSLNRHPLKEYCPINAKHSLLSQKIFFNHAFFNKIQMTKIRMVAVVLKQLITILLISHF